MGYGKVLVRMHGLDGSSRPTKSIKKLHLGALAKGVHRISRNELDGAVQEIPSVNGRESCENWRQRNPENIPNRSGTGI